MSEKASPRGRYGSSGPLQRIIMDNERSLRDWFAGQFLAGDGCRHFAPSVGAPLAYEWADAMLKARSHSPSPKNNPTQVATEDLGQ